jgi:HSP20 family protein
MARIQSEINRLFDNLIDLGGEDRGEGAWIPNADVIETESTVLLQVDLPGVAPEHLSVSVLGGNVILRGEKARPAPGAGAEVHVAERAYGGFRRVIQLGVPVNTRLAQAVLRNGLLRVQFPKVPNRRGEEVPIEVRAE